MGPVGMMGLPGPCGLKVTDLLLYSCLLYMLLQNVVNVIQCRRCHNLKRGFSRGNTRPVCSSVIG